MPIISLSTPTSLSTDQLTSDERTILDLIDKRTPVRVTEEHALEWLKCRLNPLYFIYNYVYVPEIGGRVKLTPQNFHRKFRWGVKAAYRYHKVIIMASRQLGKSTWAACLLEWAHNFYPGNRGNIINANKTYALENLAKVRFIHENLPDFLKVPEKSRIQHKTYMDYSNDSMIRVFYPSSSTSADTLARSLTAPILYIDEAAFIRHIDDAYGAAQQTLSKAREQAAKRNYPYFILITSTPNGVSGVGAWFKMMWDNAIDAELLFTGEHDDWVENADDIVNDPNKNSFIAIRYHWSEDPTKDEAWYQEQVRELNFDKRRINQELDLIFIGSRQSLYSDETLSCMTPQKPLKRIKCKFDTILECWQDLDNLDTTDYYIMGVDTAQELTDAAAYNAIEVYSFRNFEQVAELSTKLGSLTNYGDLVVEIMLMLIEKTNGRLIVGIENNSIGKAIIEHVLLYPDANLADYLYYEQQKSGIQYGINTNVNTKRLMVSFFSDELQNNPGIVKSRSLIAQIAALEKSTTGTFKSSTYTDLFMASCFCAYVRRMRFNEIAPLVEYTPEEVTEQQVKEYKEALKAARVPIFDTEDEPPVDDTELWDIFVK